MRALNILQSAINTDYDFIDKFKTDKELEDYTLLAIKEIEDLKAENRAFKKTLNMYFDEMIELRKSNKELLNAVIEAQKVIKNVLEGRKKNASII